MSVEGAAHTEAGDSKKRQSFLPSGLLGRSHSHRACFSNIKVRWDHLGVLVKLQILLQVGPEILQFLGAPKRGPCCSSVDHTSRSKAWGFWCVEHFPPFLPTFEPPLEIAKSCSGLQLWNRKPAKRRCPSMPKVTQPQISLILDLGLLTWNMGALLNNSPCNLCHANKGSILNFLIQSESLFLLIDCFTLFPLTEVTCMFIINCRHFWVMFFTCPCYFLFVLSCVFCCRTVLPSVSHTLGSCSTNL